MDLKELKLCEVEVYGTPLERGDVTSIEGHEQSLKAKVRPLRPQSILRPIHTSLLRVKATDFRENHRK